LINIQTMIELNMTIYQLSEQVDFSYDGNNGVDGREGIEVVLKELKNNYCFPPNIAPRHFIRDR
jgi:hypothetical protein